LTLHLATFSDNKYSIVDIIDFTALPAEVAQAFDSALDDGIWNTGKVQASAAYTPNTTIANTAICL